MAEVSVEFINPFLMAATSILRDMCMLDTKVGKPYVKTTEFDADSVIIMIGVTGEMKGQVIIGFSLDVACDIASKMCMMEITEMNELSMSAISELGNMILGNAATILSTKGIGIDITPPTLGRGTISFTNSYSKNICIPLVYGDNMSIELDVALKMD
ncbi:MAG: chemotaxis protein CheX [Lachnospiraceae bacterium]|nr:chemotaxis protein CheX [Lachnospiraceae bacterium]